MTNGKRNGDGTICGWTQPEDPEQWYVCNQYYGSSGAHGSCGCAWAVMSYPNFLQGAQGMRDNLDDALWIDCTISGNGCTSTFSAVYNYGPNNNLNGCANAGGENNLPDGTGNPYYIPNDQSGDYACMIQCLNAEFGGPIAGTWRCGGPTAGYHCYDDGSGTGPYTSEQDCIDNSICTPQ